MKKQKIIICNHNDFVPLSKVTILYLQLSFELMNWEYYPQLFLNFHALSLMKDNLKQLDNNDQRHHHHFEAKHQDRKLRCCEPRLPNLWNKRLKLERHLRLGCFYYLIVYKYVMVCLFCFLLFILLTHSINIGQRALPRAAFGNPGITLSASFFIFF